MPHDDFAVEPVEGLPERPPEGEFILWQGRPSALALARDALNLWWVVGYFVLLAVWRVGASSADMPFTEALPLGLPFLILGAIAAGVLKDASASRADLRAKLAAVVEELRITCFCTGSKDIAALKTSPLMRADD